MCWVGLAVGVGVGLGLVFFFNAWLGLGFLAQNAKKEMLFGNHHPPTARVGRIWAGSNLKPTNLEYIDIYIYLI